MTSYPKEILPYCGNAQQIKQKTSQLEWLKQGHNILLFGASGLTHLGAAIGHALVAQSHRVKFISSTTLVQQLQKAKEALELEGALKKLDKSSVFLRKETTPKNLLQRLPFQGQQSNISHVFKTYLAYKNNLSTSVISN